MLAVLNSGAQTLDSLQTGIDRIVAFVYKTLRASDIPEKEWDGDKIDIKNQFPAWVQEQYGLDPQNAPVIDFFIYYYRWLFDYTDGYGCGFYLEKIRDLTTVQSDLLQAYADEVFSKQLDLSEYPELIDNFRTFILLYARDYIPIRGTPAGIEYMLKTLFKATTASAITTSPTNILVTTNITNTDYKNLLKTLACSFSFNVTFITP